MAGPCSSARCRCCTGLPLGNQRSFSGPAATLHWSCIGPALVLHWSCIGPALVLHWSCSGPGAVLQRRCSGPGAVLVRKECCCSPRYPLSRKTTALVRHVECCQN